MRIVGRVEVDLSPLLQLKKSLVKKVLRKAIREASAVIKAAVKGNVQPHGLGDLAKSIGVKIRTYKDVAVAIVGPKSKWQKVRGVYKKGRRKGQPKVVMPSKIAHLVEKGSKRSKAYPFEKPAIDSHHDQYLTVLAGAIERAISAELAKAKV
jgi:HK97 gp10 family phage protein